LRARRETECGEIAEYFFNLPISLRCKTNHFDLELPGRPSLFVKYGGSDILAEASTQSFFHALAQKNTPAPGIPAVYNAFRRNGYYFLVMEKVGLPPLEACDSHGVESVAFAVKWLLDQMSSIPNSLFGRISDTKACVWHPFFKGHKAPVVFVNTEAVAKYINEALSRCPGKAAPISLSSELSICHSDIREDNFLFDVTTDHIWIVDFQHVCVLPKSFQQYAFFNTGSSLASKVGSYLGYKQPDIVEEMKSASNLLQQMGGNGSLGLDEFGCRKDSPNRR